jgi:hypothetical protein
MTLATVASTAGQSLMERFVDQLESADVDREVDDAWHDGYACSARSAAAAGAPVCARVRRAESGTRELPAGNGFR